MVRVGYCSSDVMTSLMIILPSASLPFESASNAAGESDSLNRVVTSLSTPSSLPEANSAIASGYVCLRQTSLRSV